MCLVIQHMWESSTRRNNPAKSLHMVLLNLAFCWICCQSRVSVLPPKR